MAMKEEINKFIDEYQCKIDDCDKLLDSVRSRISDERLEGNSVASLRKEQAVLFAQKNSYMQVKADFDSLIDYLN